MTADNPRWLDDSVQFPRLLSEIEAVAGDVVPWEDVAASMDLSLNQVDELISRAQVAWERIKEAR